MSKLVDAILEAVANGCSVEIRSNHGSVIVEARKRTGDDVTVCSRCIGPYELRLADFGAGYALADAVQSSTRAVLESKP